MVKNTTNSPKYSPKSNVKFSNSSAFLVNWFVLFLFLCSPERSVVEWIFWLWLFLRNHAALGPDRGGWQSQVRALLLWKLLFLPNENKKGKGQDYTGSYQQCSLCLNFLRILDHGHSRGSMTGRLVPSSHSVCVSSDAFNLKSGFDSFLIIMLRETLFGGCK